MPLSEQIIREHMKSVVLERLSREADRRQEALQEYFSVAMPGMDEAQAQRVSSMIPAVLPELYEKWVAMFIDRITETVPAEQLELLCDGSEESNASIVLVYIMFLESERMEKQIAEDLAAYGQAHSDDPDLGADYIRAKMVQLGGQLKKQGE
jgi:HPt (histidine-containing phosphotransfer) domain-containing protein